MLRAVRKRLPLILATWLSLFLGVQSATSMESFPIGSFGPGDNWDVALSIDDDGVKSCYAITTNGDRETFALSLKEDDTADLNLLFPSVIVSDDKILDIELRIGVLTWTLEDTRFLPDREDGDNFALFEFGDRAKIDEFMDDLKGAPIVTLHQPEEDDPYSTWFFDGYAEALDRIRMCRSYITAPTSGTTPRPESRPASTSELKPGEKKV